MPDWDQLAKQTSAAALSIDDISACVVEAVARQVAMELAPLRDRIVRLETLLEVKSGGR